MIEIIIIMIGFSFAWWLGGKITNDSFKAGYDRCIEDILKAKEN